MNPDNRKVPGYVEEAGHSEETNNNKSSNNKERKSKVSFFVLDPANFLLCPSLNPLKCFVHSACKPRIVGVMFTAASPNFSLYSTGQMIHLPSVLLTDCTERSPAPLLRSVSSSYVECDSS